MKSKSTEEMRESKLLIGDRHINYAVGPDNGPPMLLLHGISGRWEDWDSVLPFFTSDWHVYAVDLRGHGKSSWVNNDYRWRQYALDQMEFIEGVIGESVFVVGHSLGGVTALGLNAERTDLVRGAVYEDPPLFVHQRWEGNQFRLRFTVTLQVLDTNPDFATVLAHVKETNPDYDDAGSQDRAEKLMAMDPDVFRTTLSGRARSNWRSEDLLQRAQAPGLLLQAEPSLGSALFDDEAEKAMELLPRAEYEKWEDSGHGMHSSFPERFADRVLRFFDPIRNV
ncbi:MAG: alpha/beta hydrolase [Chloroflexi bacterium]|nr:alpha/beta hydrolase [Chloroflexota bacterium]